MNTLFKCPQCGLFIAGEQQSEELRYCPRCHDAVWHDEATTPPLVYYGVLLLLGVLATAVTYALTEGEYFLIATGPIIIGFIGVVYHLVRGDT